MSKNEEIVLIGVLLAVSAIVICFLPGILEATEKPLRTLVTICDTMGGKIDENGDFIEMKPEIKDAYGNNIQARYVKGEVLRTLYLTSAGPDGKFDTDDDLVVHKTIVLKHATKALEQFLGDIAKAKAKGAVQGATEAIKEYLSRTQVGE